MQSIETDDILFEILNASAELKAALSGGIFVQGERPDNSGKEDVVINNLFLNHEVPQTGTSNVNIHVPDKKERIGRTEQFKAHRERIRETNGYCSIGSKIGEHYRADYSGFYGSHN